MPYVDRPEELSAIKIFHSNSQKFVVLTGHRGVGKSVLARKYADTFPGSVLWMNSTTITQMVHDFKTLHTSHIGPVKGKKITESIRAVFDHFKGKNTLYIFDGANSDNVLLVQLQRYIKEDDPSKVIITSRNNNWDANFSIVSVDVFTTAEAIKYIKEALKDLSIPKEDANCKEFARQLTNLPLALKKSIDFIIKQNRERVYTMEDFIYEMKHGVLPSTPAPHIPQEDPDIDWGTQIQDETQNLGDKIGKGASEAWETVSSGANKLGGQISHGAQKAGHEISKAAEQVGSSVKHFFSGFG